MGKPHVADIGRDDIDRLKGRNTISPTNEDKGKCQLMYSVVCYSPPHNTVYFGLVCHKKENWELNELKYLYVYTCIFFVQPVYCELKTYSVFQTYISKR